ncbi:MAG TPA: type II toxin-antitoxin system prevent-host-death family antitoxin [Acetobacteraceae bacterium]|nr:type II toxin-antitoxin system prevent-host-death family antitoxin [Acetobacteraceae bacterium]
MDTIGAFEAKTHLSDLLDRVEKGERFTITRHGKAIAELAPISGRDKQATREAIRGLKALSKGHVLGMDWRELRDAGRRY